MLRPDRLDDGEVQESLDDLRPVYQMITGGYRHGMFKWTSEESLRRQIHHAMLRRTGLSWPNQLRDPPYWSTDEQQQIRNLRIYHGLRRSSLRVINRLIREAVEEAAVPEAVTQARRFRFGSRRAIYERGARSSRVLEFIVTFPVLALEVYRPAGPAGRFDRPRAIQDGRSIVAARLVERGAPLRQIAGLMDVPMSLRRVKPGAADAAIRMLRSHKLADALIHTYMPDSLPRMKAWLAAVEFASRTGRNFVEWTAKHAFEIAGRTDEIVSFLSDTADWITACNPSDDPFGALPSPGAQLVTRPFCSDMSLRTVKRLSDEWHEAVANNMDGPNQEFPDPWCEGGLVGDCEIRPITNSAGLYREGHAMHHCAGTYAEKVREGRSYIYSVRNNGNRVATAEIVRRGQRAVLGQLRGPCNSQVSPETKQAIRKWLRAQKEFRFPQPSEVPFFEEETDEIPF
ncbi:MAG: hypothetical protein GY788_06775 [bacterium]|nr:hypothetical protein [bacterium]